GRRSVGVLDRGFFRGLGAGPRERHDPSDERPAEEEVHHRDRLQARMLALPRDEEGGEVERQPAQKKAHVQRARRRASGAEEAHEADRADYAEPDDRDPRRLLCAGALWPRPRRRMRRWNGHGLRRPAWGCRRTEELRGLGRLITHWYRKVYWSPRPLPATFRPKELIERFPTRP